MTPNQTAEINIAITFRHTESTEALKSYAHQKVSHCLEKYVSGQADVQLVLCVEKRDHIVEVKLHNKEFDISCKSVTEDLYSAIDKVVDVLEAQIRKQKERLKSHRHPSIKEIGVPE